MIKKIKLVLIFFFILNSCGFKPIYSSKNINFSIKDIKSEKTLLNNAFVKAINDLVKNSQDNNKKYTIFLESNKVETVKSKDSKGNPEIFELSMNIKIIIKIDEEKLQEKIFYEKISFNNDADKFKLNQYKRDLEEILFNKLIENIMNFLSNF